ncbi:ABC transporter permease [Oleiharenicola sp. Vm1]|uniref:ABC transporter permease n=1 Tax=Oleiharenicola sp. Vm1 TaxID=3398393 RepID=UPI0039F4AA9C
MQGLRVSPNLFALLGVKPVRGRLLTPADEAAGAAKVAVISEEFWQGHFGGRDDAVGRVVRLSGELRTIVGVMPASFIVPLNGYNKEVVVPLQPEADATRHNHNGVHSLVVVGRLEPGVTPTQALADLANVLAALKGERPETYGRFEHNLLVPLAEQISGDVRPVLGTLWGSSARSCCWPARTSPVCCSCAASAGGASWRSARRSAVPVSNCCGCCSPSACC